MPLAVRRCKVGRSGCPSRAGHARQRNRGLAHGRFRYRRVLRGDEPAAGKTAHLQISAGEDRGDAAVRRKEDFRFLTGQGTYTDDINRPGQLHALLLRSPHAHAELGTIDTAAAKAAPGGKPMIEPPHPLLAQGKVRHVGDPVAVVVAETLEQAKDAAELIDVSYKTLPAVVTSEEAIKPGSPLLFDTAPGNLCFDWHLAAAATPSGV